MMAMLLIVGCDDGDGLFAKAIEREIRIVFWERRNSQCNDSVRNDPVRIDSVQIKLKRMS